jgi:hypothetical protein
VSDPFQCASMGATELAAAHCHVQFTDLLKAARSESARWASLPWSDGPPRPACILALPLLVFC